MQPRRSHKQLIKQLTGRPPRALHSHDKTGSAEQCETCTPKTRNHVADYMAECSLFFKWCQNERMPMHLMIWLTPKLRKAVRFRSAMQYALCQTAGEIGTESWVFI